MKKITFSIVFFAILLIFSCTEPFPAGYIPILPELPENWVKILGKPHWRLEWLDKNGNLQSIDVKDEFIPELKIPITWTNPVLIWPFWPEHYLIPGYFKPAGALFPFDIKKNNILLSWEAGIDAVFYKELAFAGKDKISRNPAYFDWLRFRELFNSKSLNEAVINDPWVVNWRLVAEKTLESGFDRRRIVPQSFTYVTIPERLLNRQLPNQDGEWYGTSPFCKPLFFTEDEPYVFPVSAGINIWISQDGILKCTKETFIFSPLP